MQLVAKLRQLHVMRISSISNQFDEAGTEKSIQIEAKIKAGCHVIYFVRDFDECFHHEFGYLRIKRVFKIKLYPRFLSVFEEEYSAD